MDKKEFAIGILSLMATLLLAGIYFSPPRAQALMTIKDRDFSLVTARTQENGDVLYVLDNRSGKVAIYSYDPAGKVIRPRVAGDMVKVFPN